MLRFRVQNQRLNRSFLHAWGPIEFGRVAAPGSVARCVLFDDAASKRHLRVTELDGSRVLLENLSHRLPVGIVDADALAMGQSRDVRTPVTLTVGGSRIDVDSAGSAEKESSSPGRGREFETIALPVGAIGEPSSNRTFLSLRDDMSPDRLLRWFETLVNIQRAAAGSAEFYQQTAEALVKLVGLDYGVVLLGGGESFEVVGEHRSTSVLPGRRRSYSQSLVRSVLRQKRTLYQNADVDDMSKSLADIDAVVASPILDGAGGVVGVVYGSKSGMGEFSTARIGALEAQVVQLLAAAVGTGLARLEGEAKAARVRVQFEQFFSRPLAEELARNPALLEGRERDVTVLFADIRGFSRLAQTLNPVDYYRFGQDVLGRMTEQVQARQGVVVDYTGDGLLAMWNAPFDQPRHADDACRCALAMLGELPPLMTQWGDRAGSLVDFGIGVSTGKALVGNTGAASKLKYGPRGHVVNLGSRVESATKTLGVRVLATQATRAALAADVAVRRIGKVRLPGITDPQQLFEIVGRAEPAQIAQMARYEKALSAFEQQRFAEAADELRASLAETTGEVDLPTFQLLARALAYRKNPPREFDPCWIVEQK